MIQGYSIVRSLLRGETALVAVMMASAVTTGAMAQSASNALEEIVVTAQKREQRLIEVPFAITALSGDALKKLSASSLSDLSSTIPSLFISNQGIGNTRTEIRGISNRIGVPTIGYYIDEAGVSSEQGGQDIDVRFIDIERVEVLRGPQGTLYGQGSLGGTIRFITGTPDLNNYSGTVTAGVNTVARGGEGYKINGMFNAPLVEDQLAIRLVAGREKLPGWIDNTALGVKDANRSEVDTFRGKILWQPSTDFRGTFTAMHQKSHYRADPASDNGRTTTSPILTTGRDQYTMLNLDLEGAVGEVKVVSSSTFLDRSNKTLTDATELVFLLEMLGLADASDYTSIALPSNFTGKMYSQELRLSSANPGPLQWTAGMIYRDSKQNLSGTTYGEPIPLPVDVIAQVGEFRSKSWAAFGEVTVQPFGPEFEATVGLRYFEDKKTSLSDTIFLGEGGPEYGAAKFTTLNPRFNLSWRPNANANVYVSAAKGFRSGGFNLTSAAPTVIPPTYDVENLWTYEFGTKQRLFDGVLDIEAAVYYNEYKNVVTISRLTTFPINYRSNAGAASGFGTEFSFVLRPTEGLSFSGQINWNDLRFDEDSINHIKGDRLDFAPDMTGSIAMDYQMPITDSFNALFHIDYQYHDRVYVIARNAVNPAAGQITWSDKISTLNARVAIVTDSYDISAYVRNILNDNKQSEPFYSTFTRPIYQTPRTAGVEVQFRF